MEKIDSDTLKLGDRVKSYERQFTTAAIDSSIPFIARVDGRGFSKYTSHMKKPFDDNFLFTMNETAKQLVREFNPVLAYVQSDEISLLFKPVVDPMFSGKLSKLNSIIAATTTLWFERFNCTNNETGVAVFDCRVFNVPDEWEAINALRFRMRDAYRNSVSSAARAVFGHSKCLNKNTDEKQQMLGQLWDTYPQTARFGEIYHNVLVERPVDKSKLKPEVAARTADTCMRHEVKEFVVKCIDQPDGILETKLSSPVAGLDKIVNAPDVVFRGADARYMRDETDGKK